MRKPSKLHSPRADVGAAVARLFALGKAPTIVWEVHACVLVHLCIPLDDGSFKVLAYLGEYPNEAAALARGGTTWAGVEAGAALRVLQATRPSSPLVA